jgi:anti-sigma regulatory factor (Ser/Thr protein kinase)
MAGNSTTSSDEGQAFNHEALLYRDRPELQREITAFLTDAAAAGEPVLVALPRANLEWLRESVPADADLVRFEDMNEIGRNPSCLLPLYREWFDDHDGRARVISEPMWPERSYAEAAECLRHEALLNVVLAPQRATVLCPYDAANLESEVLAGAELTHPQVRDAAGARPSRRFGDQVAAFRGDDWPQQEPAEPISVHRFDGDLGRLRRAVVQDPRLASLSRERRDDLVFVVNEAATNAVKHGDGECTTRIWNDGDSVVSEVHTQAPLDDVLAGRRRPAHDASSGRGLWLINQLCNLVELRTGSAGTSLRMHVR